MKLFVLNLVFLGIWVIANPLTSSAQCSARRGDCSTGTVRESPTIQVCNETAGTIYVALGYLEANRWVSQGWWKILPGRCRPTITNIVGPVYDYIELEDGSTQRSARGAKDFCTIHEEFKLFTNSCNQLHDATWQTFGHLVDLTPTSGVYTSHVADFR